MNEGSEQLDTRHDRIIDDIAEICEMLNLQFERSRGSKAGSDLTIKRGSKIVQIEVQRRWWMDDNTWQRWVKRYSEQQPVCLIIVSTHARRLRKTAQQYTEFKQNVYFIDEANWLDVLPALLVKNLT